MDFVLFEDVKGNLLNGINWVDEKLRIPENAIAFTYFHQKNINHISNVQYRIGTEISTTEGLQEIKFINAVEKIINVVPKNSGVIYSVYTENGVSYFHILNKNITLVKDKQELASCLLKEVTKTYGIEEGREKMEKNIFYVKPEDTTPSSLSEGTIYSIALDEINKLSLFAIQLDPLPEITETLGHAAALAEYMEKNKDNQLQDSYRKIRLSSMGRQFLCTNISLCLLEQLHRNNGITNESMEKYNKVQMEYNKLLQYNTIEFEEALSQNTPRTH